MINLTDLINNKEVTKMKKNRYIIPALIMIGALLILTSCNDVLKFVEANENISSVSSSDKTVHAGNTIVSQDRTKKGSK